MLLPYLSSIKEEHLNAVINNNIHKENPTFSIYKFPVGSLGLGLRQIDLRKPSEDSIATSTVPEIWTPKKYPNLDTLVLQLIHFAKADLQSKGIKTAALAGLALSVPFVDEMQPHMHFASVTTNIDRCLTYCLNYGYTDIETKFYSPVTYKDVVAHNLLCNNDLKTFLENREDTAFNAIKIPVATESTLKILDFNSQTTPHSMTQKNVYALFLIVDGVSDAL
jgi:hypothetical protein